ncbi:helix-turn-helix domain-containing protein [Rossellomorea vietnamensis]|uniref:Helix-turn-helix transcriptional regulator n=1 Tax=Rossellomorea aquimaris TaxID=189382 RepID=A0A5D4TJC9_9BACI|nr:helix-turn-helix domain-containing protein [Rossellomorea aquimaris]TYS75757.1 helix-turn-helix transcriptional regulator [Rossellomorea aquimaris]
MNYEVGKKIKEIREYFNISQSELCYNICTQAMISKIEKGESIPSAEILYQLSLRLGVNQNYFFAVTSSGNNYYVDQVIEEMDKSIRQAKYQEVYELVKLEKRNPLFRHPQLKQILLWREAICTFHIEQSAEKAMEIIDAALDLSTTIDKNFSSIELKLLNSKSIFLSISNEFEESDKINQLVINFIEKKQYIEDPRIAINAYYNGSKTSVSFLQFEEAVRRAQKGIDYCMKHEQLYLLGELYYQKGNSLYNLSKDNKKEALKLMDDALWIFNKSQNKVFYQYVSEEMEKIK